MQSDCPKCGETFEQGYVLDSIATQSKPETWIEGEKPISVWESLLNEGDKRRFEVEVHRCKGCGYLESFAKTEKQTN